MTRDSHLKKCIRKLNAVATTLAFLGWSYGPGTPPLFAAGKTIFVLAGTQNGNGSSWTNAFATIQAAVNSASAGDQIWVAEGVYLETVSVSGDVSLYGGFGGSETLLSQRNWSKHPTVIDANHIEKTNVVNVLSNARLTIDGFTLRNAKFTAISLFGAGILLNANATVTAAHNIITGNSGPGILNNGSATILTNLIYANGAGVEGNIGSNTFQTCINNTIVSNQGNGISATGSSLTNIINNIVVFNKQIGLLALNGTHNCVYGNKIDFAVGISTSENIEQDPLFINQTANDFHLLPTSPCIDQGTNDGINASDVDLDGQPRIVNNLVDIGAFEWFSATAVAAPAIAPNDGAVMLSSPISISDVTPGAQIYYTINGQTPSRTSTPYTASFVVSPPVTIKAIAIKAGMTDSKVASVTYAAPILVRPGGPGTSGGHSWSTAFPTIAQALVGADDGDQIWIAAGTYVEAPTVTKGIGLYGGFNGTETLLSQRNWHTNATIISNNADHTNAVTVSAKNIAIDGFTIRNGKFTGIPQLGSGIYVLANTVLISHNIITGNSGPGIINSGAATISNNLIYGNGDSGISSFAGATLEVITNNTIVNNGNNGVSNGPPAHTTIVNNVIAFNKAIGVSTLGTDDNCVFGNKTDFSLAPEAAGNIEADPLFVNAASNDFHLKANSPCINQGDDTATAIGTVDLDNTPRVTNGHVDIGAYEYSGAAPVNQPPHVSIDSPANNATFIAPATIPLSATASDSDGTVSKVEFFNGATLLGTVTNSPYNFTWSNVGIGSYSLTAKATDNNGAATTSTTVFITVTAPPNQPPAVSLTAPANNATFMAPAAITLSAVASDSDGTVSKVEFFNGSMLLGSSTNSPYHFVWSNVGVGSYSLSARATDNNGAVTTSATISITVASPTNQPPTVSLTAPADNTTFIAPAAITLSATASDSDGTISKVEFFNGGTLLGAATNPPYTFTWINVAAGSYTLSATAIDNDGAPGVSASISVTVASPPDLLPIVFLTSPGNNATFTGPATISLEATATDQDGTVTKVEFFNGATLIDQETNPPYDFNWTNVAPGSYTLSARATDNAGGTSDSNFITITVNAPPASSPPPPPPSPAPLTAPVPNILVAHGGSDWVGVAYVVDHSAQVEMKIFSRDGRVVKTINTQSSAGEQIVKWYGDNDEGHSVVSGVYLYHLAIDGTQTQKGKFVVVR